MEASKQKESASACVLCDVLEPHFPSHCKEMASIIENMAQVKVNDNVRSYKVMTCLVAFGDLSVRSLFLMCIGRALQPTVLYSAYIKEVSTREFEVVLLSKKDIDMDDLEYLMGLFSMSVCVIPFSRYMAPDMIEAISRIHSKGRCHTGNFNSPQAQTVRRYYQRRKHIMKLNHDKLEVLRITGMQFTTANMIRQNALLVSTMAMNANLVQTLESI